MSQKKSVLAPLVKTSLISGAMVFTAFALSVGSEGAAAPDRGRDAQPQRTQSLPAAHATGETHRITVANAKVKAKRPATVQLSMPIANAPGGEGLVGEGDVLGLPSIVPGESSSQQGGVAGSGCPGEGDCLTAHGGLGCKDEECCEAVCASDAFCCVVGWEQSCVDIAMGIGVCQPPPADCTDDASPGAIYSNFAPDCISGAFFAHGSQIVADDLWWGENGGVLQEISFWIVNGSASTLNNVELEIILSRTAPGTPTGALDLSTVIVILVVELPGIDLEAESGALITVEDLAGADIFLPAPMIYAGLRYVDATFDGPGELSSLGQFVAGPVAVGASANGFWFENFGFAILTGIDSTSYGWEILADGDFGSTRILFDNAPQQMLLFNGNLTNLGWSSGDLGGALAQRWLAQPFTLPPVPEGGSVWRVTGLFPHGFDPGGVTNESLEWTVWSRDGEVAPLDGDQIISGSVPYPLLQMGHGLNSFANAIHPIEVDFELSPGDYYLTVYAANSTGAASNFAWFTNAGNGIDFVNAMGPWNWRSATFPSPGFVINQLGPPTLAPDPDQPDPNTTHTAMFFIMGEAVGDPKVPCPGDLTGSGSVGVADLLALLACWGPVTPGCENADLTGSGGVGVADLLDLLAQWGPCP